MKILITGGAGYIGSVLSESLLYQGHYVSSYDNLYKGFTHVTCLLNNPNYKIIKGDVLDESKLKYYVNDHDLVIHLAGIVGYPECDKKPELAYDVNVGGTKNVVRSLKKGQPIIHASTGSVYGDLADLCTEESPTNPISVYSKTKLEAEEIVQSTDSHINIRLATVFGLSPRMRDDLLINNFVKSSLQDGSLKVYQKDHMRTFINVNQFPIVFSYLINNFNELKGNLFNVGDNSLNYTKEQICNIIQSVINVKVVYDEFDKDTDQRNYFVSYDKINSAGLKLKSNINKDIEKLVDYYNLFT